MFITRLDGRKIEGVIYSQTDSIMRVAFNGTDDLVDFTNISGQWVSENCEPVGIEYSWQRTPARQVVSEDECICTEEMASRLVESLWTGGAGDQVKALGIVRSAG